MPSPNTNPSYVIIGAGIFGASTAYHLSQTGRFSSITLIDRGPFPCHLGASYDYQKVIRADYGDAWYLSLGVEAQREWRSHPLFSPFYHESGVVYIEGGDLGWKKKQNWDDSGIPNKVAVLKSKDLIARYPHFHDADFSTDPDCYVNPESGWAAATPCLRAVIQAAIDNGATYLQGSVSKLLFGDDGDCIGVELDGGQIIHSSKVVLAAGGTIPKILADSGPERSDIQVKGSLLGAAVATGALTLNPEQVEKLKSMPVFIHRAGVTHGEIYPPTEDNVLKFCRDISFVNTYQHASSHQSISTPPVDDNGQEDQSYAPQALKDEIALVMKGILGRDAEGLEIQSYRMCWDSFTPAQDFIISPVPTAPALFLATGGSFHGWKFLPTIGKYVVQCLEGTLSPEHAERWSWAKAQSDAEKVEKGKGAQSMLQPGREWRDLVKSVRKQKKIAFARLNDGSTLEPIQAVFPDPALAKDITNGSYVSLIGKWVQSPGAGQSHELHVDEVVELGQSNSLEHPIQKHAMAADYLRTIPHLRMRTAFQSCILRTRSALLSIIANHFSQGFGENRLPVYQVHPPLITSSDCEGAGEVFTVTPKSSQPVPLPPEANKETQAERLYFRDTKYLTVSSQLHLEAYAAELGDVYALSPTFRAEESDTPRHLAEFYMLEAEHRDVTFDELLKGVNKLVSDIANRIQNHRVADELQKYYSDHKHRDADSDEADLPDRWNRLAGEYQIITYTEAISELEKASEAKGDKLFARKPRWDQGLQLEHERWVVENLGNGFPIFVTHYPKHIKPFYMLPSTENVTAADEYQQNSGGRGETVACFDLLLPMGYCEVAGGSMREHRLENLIDNMRNKGLIKKTIPSKNDEYPFLNPDETLGSLKWYADLRRFGTSRHGGYGLGFDRLLAYLTGVANVRDVVAFPRTWGRADC